MADKHEPEPEPEVPKLPRGGSFKLSMPQLMRIGVTAAILVLVVLMRQPCSDSVSKFVTNVGSGSGLGSGNQMPTPSNVDKGIGGQYELLSPDMTEQQLKEAIDRARGSSGSGSGTSGSGGGSGSGTSGSGGGSGSGGSSGSAGSGSGH